MYVKAEVRIGISVSEVPMEAGSKAYHCNVTPGSQRKCVSPTKLGGESERPLRGDADELMR